MRRAAAILVLICACAAPQITLTPSFRTGATRVYRLVARATTTIDIAGKRQVDRTELRARSTIEITASDANGSTLKLTVTPERFTRNGKVNTLAEQQAELSIDAHGNITGIRSIGGVPADASGTSLEDLAPIIGASFPRRVLHLGDRWTEPLVVPTSSAAPATAAGSQRGRVAALRRVAGYDCAIVTVGTERPLARNFTVESQPLQLTGTELSNARIAFAFRRGFAIQIVTDAEAAFTVAGAPGAGVTVASTTTLDLIDARS